MPGSLFTAKKAYFLSAIEPKRCLHAWLHVFCIAITSAGIRRMIANMDAAMLPFKKC